MEVPTPEVAVWHDRAAPAESRSPHDKAALALLKRVRDACTITGASYLAVALVSTYDLVVYTVGGNYTFDGTMAGLLKARFLARQETPALREIADARGGLFVLPGSTESYQPTKKNRDASWKNRAPTFAAHTPELAEARLWVFVSYAHERGQHVARWASPAAARRLPSEEWTRVTDAVQATAG